jgi:hypothetical protein
VKSTPASALTPGNDFVTARASSKGLPDVGARSGAFVIRDERCYRAVESRSIPAIYRCFGANSPLRARVQKGVKIELDNQQTIPRTESTFLARIEGNKTAAKHL